MTTALTLDAIRNCLEGAVPASIATCAADGTPNVSFLSQVHYVDPEHVALSYQFFNKTHQNILVNPHATVQVIDPDTVAQYRLSLCYLRTEDDGPLFESMKAKLAGIASHVGMQDVFRLRGSDVYRVLAVEAVPGPSLPRATRDRNLLAATRRSCERLLGCAELSRVLDQAFADLRESFGIDYAMVLIPDESASRLYTVGSLGYSVSGVGSEVEVGQGIIGVAARERAPIRINHMTSEYSYGRAARDNARRSGLTWENATEIPFPGLTEPHSQIAVPLLAGRELVGVLFAESPHDMRFRYDDEDALVAFSAVLGTMIRAVEQPVPVAEEAPASPAAPGPQRGPSAMIRRYAVDNSVFVEDEYLIKGVAGAIFWKLVRDHQQHGRIDFTNRELRLSPELALPEFAENLEARLILLQRRLAERCSFVRIDKTGRGRFRLSVSRPLMLEDVARGGGR